MTEPGKKVVGYFPSWAIYDRKFLPTDIPTQHLTHLFYAFANIDQAGKVFLPDPWADYQIQHPSPPTDQSSDLKGNLGVIYQLKKSNRQLKTLLSIGGWTYSPNLHPVVVDPGKRQTFVKSAVDLLSTYGFDGLDIDYEYPQNQEQGSGFAALIRELRSALDAAAQTQSHTKYLLTIATPASSPGLDFFDVGTLAPLVDMVCVMAYDFAGSWSAATAHHAQLYPSPCASMNIQDVIGKYRSLGVQNQQIVLGMPLYGRSFAQVGQPGEGQAFQGVGKGTWEPGTVDYKAIPLPGTDVEGWQVSEDAQCVAATAYHPPTQDWITFDSLRTAQSKAAFVRDQGLGGAMFWELSGDRKDEHAIVPAVAKFLTPLETSENDLHYRSSSFQSIQ